jgi:hypothetical protein
VPKNVLIPRMIKIRVKVRNVKNGKKSGNMTFF